MIRLILALAAAAALFLHSAPIGAQERKVTPVETDDMKPQQPVLHYYDKHGNKLKEPVLFLADLDTVATPKSKPLYPAFNGVDVGFNFFDAIMKIAGQKYSSFDAWAAVSIHNWIFPTLEAGAGFASNTPEANNFTYKGTPSPYFRIGADYNFLYKSDPAYRVFVGLRLAYSTFRYNVENVSISSDYWDQTASFSMDGLRSQMMWGEVLAGLKVKIAGCFSMGWTIRYHFPFKEWNPANCNPWFIPGFGKRNSPISATFSLIFTIPGSSANVSTATPTE